MHREEDGSASHPSHLHHPVVSHHDDLAVYQLSSDRSLSESCLRQAGQCISSAVTAPYQRVVSDKQVSVLAQQ